MNPRNLSHPAPRCPSSRRRSIAIALGGLAVNALAFGSFDAAAAAKGGLEDELVIRASGGSVGAALRAAAKRFEEQTGVKTIYAEATSSAAIAAVKASGGRPDSDVIFINAVEAVTIQREGLAQSIDAKLVPNLAQTYENTRDRTGSWVPAGISVIAPAYNPAVFQERKLPPISSWNDLWRPELKQRIAFTTLANSGFTKGFFWDLQRREGSVDKAFEKMKALRPNILALTQASGQAEDLYKQGAVWAMINGNTRIFALQATGVPIAMAVPKEGLIALPQGWFIPKGAPHPKAAAAFIDSMLSAPIQADMAKSVFYGPVNRTVKLDKTVAEKVPYGPEQMKRLVQPDWALISEKEKGWIERWTQQIEAN